ncbi:hypothetical protein FRC12_023339 [Ceratobasidium sp. 428]|nr:hypothetical protein FRC12_023339 [Ceratobasidium sp. 428]
MLLVYDILIHLDNEIIHIWSSRWSLARVIYYLNRFLPLLILPCESRINVIIFLSPSVKPTSRLLPVVGYCLTGRVFTGCFIIQAPPLWLPYIFPFTFETVVFAVTIWRTRKLLSEFGTMPFVKQLLKDGSFFYAAILLTVLFTCIGATISSVQIAAVGAGFYPAFGSVMCNRLICSLYTFGGSTTASTLTRDTLGTFGLGIPMATFETGGNTTLGGRTLGPGDERSV